MKTIIIIICLTILLATSSFQLHEIKISTSEITLNKNIIQIRIKLFADDLSSSLSQVVKKPVYFNGKEVDHTTLGHLNQYIKLNFSMSINNAPIQYTFKSSVIDDNQSTQIKTVWLVYEAPYNNSQAIKIFELKNTLLFDGSPEQKNITKVSLIQNSDAKTLVFENQNNDVKRQIQF